MKRCILFLLALIFLCSTTAFAAPSLPNEELRFKFVGLEQISPNNSIVVPGSNEAEGTWGIVRMESIATPFTGDDGIWSRYDGTGDEITGIFYGFETIQDPSQGAELQSSGGSLELWYQDDPATTPTLDGSTNTPGMRSSQNSYPGFTEGEHLVKLDFLAGAQQDENDPEATIVGSQTPTTSNDFTGNSAGYITVDVGAGGAWANQFRLDYFDTDLGLNTADMQFDSRYTGGADHPWNGGEDIFGATLDDPALAHGVPEPTTLLLFGTGLLGLAAFGRKRFMKKS